VLELEGVVDVLDALEGDSVVLGYGIGLWGKENAWVGSCCCDDGGRCANGVVAGPGVRCRSS
jgi:hypothetical protein